MPVAVHVGRNSGFLEGSHNTCMAGRDMSAWRLLPTGFPVGRGIYFTAAAATAPAAKSLQSCPILCYPIDDSPPGSPVPGILQGRTLEWIAISFSNA